MTFSRREFLKAGLAGSLAVGAGGLLSACGTGNTIKPFTTSTVGKPRTGGQLRAGLTGGSTADTLSPLNAITNVDFSRINNLYEPLIGLTPDALPVYVLAEELTPNAKATEWTVRVKQGITFHNGKTLTADDVIYTFQQILNPKAPGAAAAGLASIDAKGMTKLDAYTVRIPCSTPFATLGEALAIPGYSDIIPVGFNPAAPVGTGPFKVKSFSPGTQSTFVRYDGYWQSGMPYLDEIVITDYADQTSQVNALLAGQVDAVNLLSEDVISEVQGEGKNVLLSAGRRLEPVHHAGGHRRPSATCASARPCGWSSTASRCSTWSSAASGRSATTCSGSGPRSTTTACRSGTRTSTRPSRCSRRRAPRACTSRWSPPTSRRAPCWPRRCSPSRRRRPGSR